MMRARSFGNLISVHLHVLVETTIELLLYDILRFASVILTRWALGAGADYPALQRRVPAGVVSVHVRAAASSDS